MTDFGIFFGKNKILDQSSKEITGNYVTISGEDFYRIQNYDCMPPFFMSIVSSSDHWFFISSTGGLSIGRKNSESAIFPYYTDDKISENYENTGSLTILLITKNDKKMLWEPFRPYTRLLYKVERNIYKNIPGNILIFEEINYDLNLSISTKWQTSEKYGFIKTTIIKNLSNEKVNIQVLDGLQNILPFGTSTATQNTFSNLLNAYKRSEIDQFSGIGIFALNSNLSDLAEPSESLKATIVWQIGLDDPSWLLSTNQLDQFRTGLPIQQEIECRGQRGSYFVSSSLLVNGLSEKEWFIIADVNQDSTDILNLREILQHSELEIKNEIIQDIHLSTNELVKIISGSDGVQLSRDEIVSSHHFSNVLFNVMRGGTFFNDYSISRNDFLKFLDTKNKNTVPENNLLLSSLPEHINYSDLSEQVISSNGSTNLIRSSFEYLPLSFSRRHGDPSRPWNKFSINLKNNDGTRKQDYEGNWRDIFQNWEALSTSFPEYIEGMIFKFLNATTIDGYNPYRITMDSIDWEIPEPGNPWANIGYWGDHQIIYLLKLLQASQKYHPGKISQFLNVEIFCYAHVPYKINDYEKMIDDPFQTIVFDRFLNEKIDKRTKELGTDGKLFANAEGDIYHSTFFEKILSLLLAKTANLVPGGGIWLNTQRPEWNDANNALVGKGLSLVTAGYLLNFIKNFIGILQSDTLNEYSVSTDFYKYYANLYKTLSSYPTFIIQSLPITSELRKNFMDEMGIYSSEFRNAYYSGKFSFQKQNIEKSEFIIFLDLLSRILETTLRTNKRSDNLFHSYNTLSISQTRADVENLPEMLEGQVSILSSGILSEDEVISLLRCLRNSRLYRADQKTYILYPDRELPVFLSKNSFSHETASVSKLILELVRNDHKSIVHLDTNKIYHFNGNFRNVKDLRSAIEELSSLNTQYKKLILEDSGKIYEVFESVFNHKSFTGRSGSFFAYEGLGSIYWHMVAKLLLTVQDNLSTAINKSADPEKIADLLEYYNEIRNGLGFTKSPSEFGAFPSDPYSHTPAGQGAKQPGMTGQVKEEILTRQKELGILINQGSISFCKSMFRLDDLLETNSEFEYFNIQKEKAAISIFPGSTVFTICQVPFVITKSTKNRTMISYRNGAKEEISGHSLTEIQSKHIFRRDDEIIKVEIDFVPY